MLRSRPAYAHLARVWRLTRNTLATSEGFITSFTNSCLGVGAAAVEGRSLLSTDCPAARSSQGFPLSTDSFFAHEPYLALRRRACALLSDSDRK